MQPRLAHAPLILALIAWPLAASEKDHHWSYSGAEGPSHWGGTCNKGKAQSPIEIHTADASAEKLPPLEIDYRPGTLHIIDNGHSIQVNVDHGSSMSVGGHRFDLVQFHFHKPSEEIIDGRQYAMVAHLVHRDSKGKLAVIAVPLKAGEASPLIDTLWRNIPHQKDREVSLHGVTISPGQLLPANRAYFTYMGSLTTPPCTEGVRWFVLKTPRSISIAQILAFGKFYRANSRPVQPLNKREVDAGG
ncbi:MAG TPA: carbonic anhydrase family protein [Sphingomicrobium sp.]|jgi:carbonic anhydrase